MVCSVDDALCVSFSRKFVLFPFPYFAAPILSASFAPNTAVSGGAIITVAGLEFGASVDLTSSVAIGATSVTTVAWSSMTSVQARGLPSLGNSKGPTSLFVIIASVFGTWAQGFSFDGTYACSLCPIEPTLLSPC
jgi:hypothetical protein